MANPEVEELRAQIRALSAQNAAQAKRIMSHEMQLASKDAQIKAKDAALQAPPLDLLQQALKEAATPLPSQANCEATTARVAGDGVPWETCPVEVLGEQRWNPALLRSFANSIKQIYRVDSSTNAMSNLLSGLVKVVRKADASSRPCGP